MRTTNKWLGSIALLAVTGWVVQEETAVKGSDLQEGKPEVGKPAPTVRLNDERGKAVRLGPGADTGWTVLAFYPKAATPG